MLRNKLTETQEKAMQDGVLDTVRGVRDVISVSRVFGKAYEFDGVQIIPVARIAGRAGGGGGEGVEGTESGDKSGGGFGTGFGVGAHPLGVYEVRNGEVRWRPSFDVNRMVRGSQVLAGIIAVCTVLIVRRRE